MKKLYPLKNCPFCKCKATLYYDEFTSCMDINYETFVIKAKHKPKCPMRGLDFEYDTEKQAIKAWNTRR
jgi:hypothetical protein